MHKFGESQVLQVPNSSNKQMTDGVNSHHQRDLNIFNEEDGEQLCFDGAEEEY